MAETAIATNGLTKQFERHIAVNEVHLEIARGEVYGLIGPNGAGKTTLIRMLAAAEEPTTGEIYINGQRLERDDSNPVLKQYIGYLPDDFPVYDDLTVWDYLEYFARLYNLKGQKRRQRLYDVLDLVQLGSKRNAQVSTLSRGMKQRLSLARTIIHEPVVLFLDEPVSGLDPIARMQFREIIKTLQEAGMTVLISSHVLSDLAELCSSIGIMELGCLVESASLNELYQRLSNQQIILSTTGELEPLKQALKKNTLVTNWEPLADRNSLKVNFAGTPEESAQLLKELILAGITISDFHTIREDLESIFLKLGHQQVS